MFGSQFVLSAAQINTLAADLAPLGQQPGVRLALLLDLSGQEIVYIDSYGGLLIPSIAALAWGYDGDPRSWAAPWGESQLQFDHSGT